MKNVCLFLWRILVRILKSVLEILVWIDQGIGLIISIPFYLVFGRPRPNADETISSIVGFYASDGYRWAILCEWFIDRLFYIPEGFRLGHCRKYTEEDDIDWEDISNHL
jgi:hypothetical protein